MSHLVQGCKEVDDPATTSNRANFPVKALLEKAQSREQVYNIIWDAFTRKLGSYFQFDAVRMNSTELSATRFDHMGIDSLTAIEIRGWFMMTLEVNTPVLKIMNGGTVGELVTAATETIPSRLLLSLDKSSVKDDTSAASSNSQKTTHGSGIDIERPAAFSQERFGSNLDLVQDYPRATSSGSVIQKSLPVLHKRGFILRGFS